MEQGHQHQCNCQSAGNTSRQVLSISRRNRTSTQENGQSASPWQTFEIELRRYKYGDLQYPSFVTSGNYRGEVLFHSSNGLVAGATLLSKRLSPVRKSAVSDI